MRYFKSEKCTTCGDEKYSYLKPDELDELNNVFEKAYLKFKEFLDK